jgi:glycosyltransferase 2 family protein
MRPVYRLLTAAVVAASVLWCALRLRSDLAATSLLTLWQSRRLVLAAAFLSLLNYAVRAARWRWYLARLGHALSLRFAFVTYCAGFAFTLSPGKLGEVARARYYTALGVPLRDITAAFCLERLMDVVAVVALAMCVFPTISHHSSAIFGAAAIFTAVTRSASSVVKAARPLVRPPALLVGLGLGLLAWGLEAIGLYVLSFIFPTVHLGLAVAIGIYAIAVLAGALAMLPGGLGGTEAVMAALLVSQGLPLAAAVLLTVTCRLVTLWFAVGLGWAAILALRIRRPVAEVVLGSR